MLQACLEKNLDNESVRILFHSLSRTYPQVDYEKNRSLDNSLAVADTEYDGLAVAVVVQELNRSNALDVD